MIVLNSGIGNYILGNGKRYSYFGGSNYLGLASHPEVKEAVLRSVEKYGVNFSASRHTTGTADIHLELEKALAEFKEKEDAAAFASGYMGNGILLDILKDRYTVVFADRSAHASITAGIPRGTEVLFYDHCDAGSLEDLLCTHPGSRPLVITDGIFALTGEIAPLDKIFPTVKKHNAILVVDDAHSTGVIGATGKGTPEYFHLYNEENIYQTETMSKALGGYGGFISGDRDLVYLIREKSAAYQASTALPPPIAAAGIAAVRILRGNPDLRTVLIEKAGGLRRAVTSLGIRTTQYDTPIVPLMMTSPERAKGLSMFLEENGIIVPFVSYPVRQEMHILRIAVSVNHTTDQIEQLLEKLNKWMRENGKD